MIPDAALTDPFRLTTLKSYKSLETGPEKAFDDLADLARQICATPVGLVSLVDEDKQWFKAARGLDAETTSTDQSICATILDERDVVVLPDLDREPKASGRHIDIDGAPVRFYAGMPLIAPNGMVLGTLCVLDTEPRKLTQVQINTLRILGRQVVAQLDLRRALQRGDVLRREIDHRVKNSLQSVASLTRIQARSAGSDDAREALQVVARRIASVAALNSEIYRAEGTGQIGLRHFLETVRALIQDSAPENVSVETTIEDLAVRSNQAGALAIVVNEFATNAFKHAFPEGRTGTIRYNLTRTSSRWATLDCRDDGIGLPEGDEAPGGMGFSIIESAVDQLFGQMEVADADPGLRIRVTFPL